MKLINHIEDLPELNYAVVTSGTYDGVHYGHRKILKKVVDTAKSHNGESVVLTFWPHPRYVLGKDAEDLKLLTTFEEKATLMEETGIDYLVKIHFTREFSELSSSEFIQSILIEGLQTRKLIIGYDHRFGRNQEGSFQYLKEHQEELGFEVEEIARQDIDDVTISSTKIRQALQEGNVAQANSYLGHDFTISGLVTKGDQVGRQIGFPTANIYVTESTKIIPGDGVYAVYVMIDDEKYRGMLNIGMRPTLSGKQKTIEVNIFDFDEDIYGQMIQVRFIQLLRKEKKFENLEELKSQLLQDKQNVMKIFEENK